MITSSNGNIFRVTGHLCGEFTGHRWIRGALVFSLICAWINGWVNNGQDGNLRRHRAHYDVTVIFVWLVLVFSTIIMTNLQLCMVDFLLNAWNDVKMISETKISNNTKKSIVSINHTAPGYLKFAPKVQLTINRYWLRRWSGTKLVTSHYLNQLWSSFRHKCGNRPRRIITKGQIFMNFPG